MSAESYIDSSAKIDPSAKLGVGVRIGPFCVVGPNVELGDNCVLKSHVVIPSDTVMGKDNVLQSGAIVGGDSQARDFDPGERTQLIIGDNNRFHSFCTVNRGSGDGNVTRIGSNNIIMAYCHVAHDCVIGNHVVMVNNATLAGHVEVHDYANIGCMTMVHQFCKIGAHAFMPRAAKISKDVLPYVIVSGEPAKLYGLNTVGLSRRGFSEETLSVLNEAYRVIFRESLKQEEAVAKLEQLAASCPEVRPMLEMLTSSERGIMR